MQTAIKIFSACSYPLSILAIIGALFALKGRKKISIILIALFIFCISWRVYFKIESSRYALFLVIPAVYFSGFVGEKALNLKKNKNMIIRALFSALLLTMITINILLALRSNQFYRFFMDSGEMISSTNKWNKSSVLIDYSEKNALRYNFYSNCTSVQEENTKMHDLLSGYALSQKAENYLRIYDVVFFITSDSNSYDLPESEFDLFFKGATNRKKNKQIYLLRATENRQKASESNRIIQTIWDDDFTATVPCPPAKEINANNIKRKILSPSCLLPKDWAINYSDGNLENAKGIIELIDSNQGKKALHMSSENTVTIMYNKLFSLSNDLCLLIEYMGLSESLFDVKIDFFEKNHWIGGKKIESIRIPRMQKSTLFRCKIPATYKKATHFRITLLLHWGEVLFYKTQLISE